MRRILLDGEKKQYKANLHSHSTVSDGILTPEEMKELYKKNGYSVLSFTDHGKFVRHNELTDPDFLVINGYEADITENIVDPEWKHRRTCHICLLAPNEDVESAPLPRECGEGYNAEHINELIRRGVEEGFFVTYNHPTWSRERADEYMSYRGMHCMEIVNFNCIAGGTPEWNETIYDHMLSRGEKIYAIATDDNHNTHWFFDSFGGFAMILADELSYKSIFDALMSGSFYASEGPVIKSVYVEDGTVSVFCSEAVSVRFNTGTRRGKNQTAKPGEAITSAFFKVAPDDKYVRITVTDKEGKHAYTSAFFTEDIL